MQGINESLEEQVRELNATILERDGRIESLNEKLEAGMFGEKRTGGRESSGPNLENAELTISLHQAEKVAELANSRMTEIEDLS